MTTVCPTLRCTGPSLLAWGGSRWQGERGNEEQQLERLGADAAAPVGGGR